MARILFKSVTPRLDFHTSKPSDEDLEVVSLEFTPTTLSDIISYMEQFLRAMGYHFSGHLAIEEEEEIK